jgi:YbbR domain-containing protein
MKAKLKKYIKKYVISDWPVKVMCILAAMFLWIYVASGQSTIGKFPSKIPIKAENVQTGLIPVYDDNEVELQISAEPAVWNKLSTDSFMATVDLSGLSEGTYQLPVSVISGVEGVQIVKKTPDKIMVSLEPIIKKTVSVNRKIQGSPADGMVVGNVTFDFPTVEVSGPKSIVEGISEAIVVVDLNGEANNFDKTISLQAFDEKGDEISGVIFNPMEVKTTVTVVKAGNSKTVGIRPQITGNPIDGFYISKVTVSPNLVSVTGADNVLSNLNYLDTAPVDVSGVSGSVDKTVSLTIPDGVALDKNQPSKIKVSIVASENIISRVIPATIAPQNLDNLTFSINPQIISVSVSGTQSQINNLSAGDISWIVDLSGKAAGTYSVDVITSDIKAPSGVVVNSFTPTAVSIVLVNK